MTLRKLKIFIFGVLLIPFSIEILAQNPTANGYKGIWFTLGQFSEYGDKYSGGLGTYTANHIPIAIYAPEVKKTFFTYGGTTAKDERHLLIMVSYFDHLTKTVPKPVVVYDKEGVNDPHDNAAISIDGQGFIWVFVSGRNTARPGLIFKSSDPYSIESFNQIKIGEMTYPQPWWFISKGFFYLFTKYTKGRELYWTTSPDGKYWAPDQKLAGMGGHYQVSNRIGNKMVSVFNYHPGGNVDKRTNIYLMQTEDLGRSWKTVDGKVLTLPLTDIHTPALVHDYEAEGKLVYLNDVNFDKEGNPVILAVISNDYRPGPKGDPREWTILHWKNGKWNLHKVCTSTHNYDMGSLYIEKGRWCIIGPTETGPQKFGAGGEVALWESKNEGVTWKKVRNITQNSPRNNSYARRPLSANPDFYSFWADGNADQLSESRFYFTNQKGNNTWVLPYEMNAEFAKPEQVK
ncbi:MAG: BNR repeat-containing protein [Prolixibacteraceae bacterium]|nr:BNR repeat-containing protein [Prolixibacteraceae bacterium]